jgi:hypothetical protein
MCSVWHYSEFFMYTKCLCGDGKKFIFLCEFRSFRVVIALEKLAGGVVVVVIIIVDCVPLFFIFVAAAYAIELLCELFKGDMTVDVVWKFNEE